VTADRHRLSSLGARIALDVAALMTGPASVPITINGVAARGIMREYVGAVDDPRNPEIYVQTDALPAGQHRVPVVIGAETFTLTGVQPVAPNLVRLVLT